MAERETEAKNRVETKFDKQEKGNIWEFDSVVGHFYNFQPRQTENGKELVTAIVII